MAASERARTSAKSRGPFRGIRTLRPAKPAPRPDVLLVVVEDLDRDDLGCYGAGLRLTPHLDRLARSGVRLNQFVGASAGPPLHRTALVYGDLTEAWPAPNERLVRLDRPRWPVILKQADYETVALGDTSWLTADDGTPRGWDQLEDWSDRGPQAGAAAWLAATQERSAEDRSDHPRAVFLSLRLAWWMDGDRWDPIVAELPMTDLEKRRATALLSVDRLVGGIVDSLQTLAVREGLLVVVVGLPREKLVLPPAPRRRGAVSSQPTWPLAPALVIWPERLPQGAIDDGFGGFQDVLPTLEDILEINDRPSRRLGTSHWKSWQNALPIHVPTPQADTTPEIKVERPMDPPMGQNDGETPYPRRGLPSVYSGVIG